MRSLHNQVGGKTTKQRKAGVWIFYFLPYYLLAAALAFSPALAFIVASVSIAIPVWA
jgi:hypothetical protein